MQRSGSVASHRGGDSAARDHGGSSAPSFLIAGVLAAFLAAILVAVTLHTWIDYVSDERTPAGVDSRALSWMLTHRGSWQTATVRAVTVLGSGPATLGVAVVLVAVMLSRKRWLIGGFLVLAIGGSALLEVLVSVMVDRDRPPASSRLTDALGGAVPSGGAALAIACYGALAYVIVLVARARVIQIAVWLGAALVAAAISFSRVYLAAQWASDVVAECAWTTAWLCACIAIHRQVVQSQQVARQQAEPIPGG